MRRPRTLRFALTVLIFGVSHNRQLYPADARESGLAVGSGLASGGDGRAVAFRSPEGEAPHAVGSLLAEVVDVAVRGAGEPPEALPSVDVVQAVEHRLRSGARELARGFVELGEPSDVVAGVAAVEGVRGRLAAAVADASGFAALALRGE